MPATRKNESVRVSVSISADPRLAAALQTEVETSEIENGFHFEINADSISDARARMNKLYILPRTCSSHSDLRLNQLT